MSARISPAPIQRDPLIGQLIGGRYRIDRIHAHGGMSVVYAATYEAQQREVALKVIDDAYSSDPKAIDRFMREARTASGISHGHVVGVTDYGILTNGRPYLVMPLITGQDLATVVAEQGPLPAQRVVSLLSGVASALDWMHAQGLVHRDVKSENIMHVRGDDGTESALVLDFGIAARASVEDDDASGTPDFMAPEVLAGEPSDRRADIYSLATVAFELLAGRLPYQGNDLPELLRNRAKDRPRTLAEVTQISFHPALEAAIARGLARKPADRPSSASEFVLELKRAAARARAPLTAPPKQKQTPVKTVSPQSGVRETARRRPVVRLRTLVGFPFAASASEPPPKPEVTPERLPSIMIDPSLQADVAQLAAEPARAPEPASRPITLIKPISNPLAPRVAEPLDSLSPLPELELTPPMRASYAWLSVALRVGLPAAAVLAILLIVLTNRDGDIPVATSLPPAPSAKEAVQAPAPSAPVAALPVEAAAPAPTPEPVPPAPLAKPEAQAPARPLAAKDVAVTPAPRVARAPRDKSQSLEPKPTPRPAPRPQGDAKALTTEGVDAMLRGDFGGALDKLSEATAANPRYAPAFRNKGLLYERLNRPKDAANAFRQYLRLSPSAPDADKIKARLTALE
jgi:serine/threonine-protein kinase